MSLNVCLSFKDFQVLICSWSRQTSPYRIFKFWYVPDLGKHLLNQFPGLGEPFGEQGVGVDFNQLAMRVAIHHSKIKNFLSKLFLSAIQLFVSAIQLFLSAIQLCVPTIQLYLYPQFNYLYPQFNYLYPNFNNLYPKFNYLYPKFNYLYT